MFASWRVGIILSAMNLTGPGFKTLIQHADEANTRVQKLNDSMQYLKMGAAFALGEVGRIGVSGFLAAADAAGKFQLNMNLLAQQTNANVQQLTQFRDIALELSTGKSRTFLSMNQIGDVMRELQQSGISVGNLLGKDGKGHLIREVAYLAELENLRYGSSPGTTAKAVGSVVKGYGLDQPGHQNEMASFANMVSKISSQTHMKIQDLMTLETQFGQTARTFNMSPMAMLELFGFLRQRGFQASTAATSLSNLMVNTMPTFSLNATKTAAKTQALAMMGLLQQGNVGQARTMLNLYEKQMSGLGLPVNPATMTAKQQSALAQAVMIAVTSGRFGAGKKPMSALDLVEALHNAELNFEKLFGKQKGHQIFASMGREAVNLRGFRAMMAIADNEKQFKEYLASVAGVNDLDTRIGILRGQYIGQTKALPNEISTLLTSLGGVKVGMENGRATFIATPGGPLDTVTHVLAIINNFLGRVNAWAGKNGAAAARLGTLLGVLGVGGFVGAAVLATSATLELTRALLTYTGAAGSGGLRGVVARLLGTGGGGAAVGEAEMAAERGLWRASPGAMRRAFWDKTISPMFKWTGKIGGWNHPMNPFFMEDVGQFARRLPGGDAEWITMRQNWFQQRWSNTKALGSKLFEGSERPEILDAIKLWAARVAEFAPRILSVAGVVGKVLFGVADIVGWIWLAWTALDFVIKHAWDVGYWTGMAYNAVKAVTEAIWNGMVNLSKGIWNLLQGLWTNLTHPMNMVQGWKGFWSQFRDGFLKAVDPKKWAHEQANEHRYLKLQHDKANRATYHGLTSSPLYGSSKRQIQELHDKRQFHIVLEMSGVNMIDPNVQRDLQQKTADEVMKIIEKDTNMHRWSTPTMPSDKLWPVGYDSGQGRW